MGFVPPTNNSGQKPTVVQQPAPPAAVQSPPTPANPGLGSVVGQVLGTNPPSGQQSSGGGGILGTVGNVIGDVLNPLGALTSLL
jgi:hypothetical protein